MQIQNSRATGGNPMSRLAGHSTCAKPVDRDDPVTEVLSVAVQVVQQPTMLVHLTQYITVLHPAKCWIVPTMPQAMIRYCATTLPVC